MDFANPLKEVISFTVKLLIGPKNIHIYFRVGYLRNKAIFDLFFVHTSICFEIWSHVCHSNSPHTQTPALFTTPYRPGIRKYIDRWIDS